MGVIGHLGSAPTPRIMRASLADIGRTHTLRCDAKQAEDRFRAFDAWIGGVPHFTLGSVLPTPIVKGSQPNYLDGAGTGIPVITTLAIQDLSVVESACRYVDPPDWGPNDVRKPCSRDVLLTVDGGTSIGKPVLFDLPGDWAVDSHVAILRPVGLDPALLVYLLASPLGQLQFQRAESGASGQTAVTEEDIRRFRFPQLAAATAVEAVRAVNEAAVEAAQLRATATATQEAGWEDFLRTCAPGL